MEQRPKKLLDQVRESIRRSTILFTLSKLMPLGSGVFAECELWFS